MPTYIFQCMKYADGGHWEERANKIPSRSRIWTRSLVISRPHLDLKSLLHFKLCKPKIHQTEGIRYLKKGQEPCLWFERPSWKVGTETNEPGENLLFPFPSLMRSTPRGPVPRERLAMWWFILGGLTKIRLPIEASIQNSPMPSHISESYAPI
jgi:hypothetical protein